MKSAPAGVSRWCAFGASHVKSGAWWPVDHGQRRASEAGACPKPTRGVRSPRKDREGISLQGGSDFDLNRLVALCRSCHDQTDAPYGRGRLIITPLGLGQFHFTIVERAGKWARAAAGDFAHVGNAE